uniref:hypothetical protein n=1 Tax=Polynucleobacter sp. TaxID=2029855 RepID=UPI0040473A63
MISKFILYYIFEKLTHFNKNKVKKINIISRAGIGDSIYAGIFCAESSKECFLYTASKNIEICSLYYDKVFDTKDLDFLQKESLYYSDRSLLNLIDLIKIFLNRSCFIKNSIYESPNFIKRICNKLRIRNYKYYGKTNSRKRFYDDINIKSSSRKYISVYRSFNIDSRKRDYIVIHPFGSDSIRKLTKSQIENIIEYYSNNKIYIVGSIYDKKYFNEYNLNINLTIFDKATDLLEFLSGAKKIICVDSMISHLVSTLLSNPVTIYYGNTFSSYFMPQTFSNISLIDNYQKCTPCNRTYCDKINGLSCVQNIYL